MAWPITGAEAYVRKSGKSMSRGVFLHIDEIVGEKVRRERRWTSAGATPARELVRSTR